MYGMYAHYIQCIVNVLFMYCSYIVYTLIEERIPPRPRNDDEKNGTSPRTDPFEEILILNDNLNTWKGDATNRMGTLTKTLLKLQRKLEELDDFAQHGV